MTLALRRYVRETFFYRELDWSIWVLKGFIIAVDVPEVVFSTLAEAALSEDF